MAGRACRRAPAAQLGRVAGQHPGLGDQRRRQRVDRDPGCGEPGGQEVGQSVQPGLGRRMMRADDAAGERGDPGDEQDPAGPRSRMEPAAHWASRNGARRFTASISSNWAAVMSCSGWRWLSPSLLASTAHPPGPALRRPPGRADWGLRAAQVGADRGRRAAGRGDLRRQCLGGLAVGAVAEPRHGPAGGQPACQRLPDAAARAGDQRDPSAEWSVHACEPVTPDDRSPWRVAAGRRRR